MIFFCGKSMGGKMNGTNEQMNKKMEKKEKHSEKKLDPQLPVAHARTRGNHWRHFRSKAPTMVDIAQFPVAHAQNILPVTWRHFRSNGPVSYNSNNTAPSIGTIAGWGLELSLWLKRVSCSLKERANQRWLFAEYAQGCSFNFR